MVRQDDYTDSTELEQYRDKKEVWYVQVRVTILGDTQWTDTREPNRFDSFKDASSRRIELVREVEDNADGFLNKLMAWRHFRIVSRWESV
jgi:hypothetical protein